MMERINAGGFAAAGMAGDSMSIRNNQAQQMRDRFSRIMDEALRQEQGAAPTDSAAAEPRLNSSSVSDIAHRIVPQEVTIDRSSKLFEQTQALETFLVKNLLNSMRNNVLRANLIDTGFAGEVYEDMLWDEYARMFTQSAGFGLAELAYLELTGQRGRRM